MYSFITGKFPNRDGSVVYNHVAVFAENQYAPDPSVPGGARIVGQKSASRSFTSQEAMLSHAKGILGGECVINGASVILAPAAPAEKPAKGK